MPEPICKKINLSCTNNNDCPCIINGSSCWNTKDVSCCRRNDKTRCNFCEVYGEHRQSVEESREPKKVPMLSHEPESFAEYNREFYRHSGYAVGDGILMSESEHYEVDERGNLVIVPDEDD